MPGLNATWIIPHEHAKHVEGTTFVRVAGPHPHNASLLKLVCENNRLAKGMNLRSLASSCGLMELRMARNATQARELGAPASTLFAADSGTPRKARRMSRGALNTMRMISHSMEIEVPLVGNTHLIQVLKPVSAKDALYVEFEANTMSVVIQCLREFGFAPVDAMKLKPDGEKGIQRRKHDKVKKQLGKHKSKWDALELQMENALDREVTQIFQSWRLTKRKTQKKTNKPQKNEQTNGACSQWMCRMQPMDMAMERELEIHQSFQIWRSTKRKTQKEKNKPTKKWSMQQMFVHT